MIGIKSISVHQRVKYVRRTVGVFFVVGIFLSLPLWTSDRFFPMAPVIGVAGLGNASNSILLAILILSLLGWVFVDEIVLTYVALGALVIILLQDQLRWQPWVYLYFLVLLTFAVGGRRKSNDSILNCLKIIIIGIYVWSGIQKLNPGFIDNTFKTILTFLFRIQSQEIISYLGNLGYSIPLSEISIGIALAIPRLRNIGVILAVSTHLFIMIYLSPLGMDSNTIVYPWNLAMMLLVALLFFEMKMPLVIWSGESLRMRILGLSMILLIWILPALNFFQCWDHYLSFSLYSDKPSRFYIAIADDEMTKIDQRLVKYFVNIKGLSGGQIIDIDNWCRGELKVPFYPEKRVFIRVAKSFCGLGIAEAKLIFLELKQPVDGRKIERFTCKDILSRTP